MIQIIYIVFPLNYLEVFKKMKENLVMKTRVKMLTEKKFISKIYFNLSQLEKAVFEIGKYTSAFEISVLGKVGHLKIDLDRELDIKNYWIAGMKDESEFGHFFNPEIGTIFIAGPLAPLFLDDMGGKSLGSMSSGPYGILRGLGINEEQAATQIKKLNQGGYLLIVRGHSLDARILNDALSLGQL